MMDIDKARNEFEASFLAELDVDLSGSRHTDDHGLECYQFDGDDEDERSKLASIAFLFWQASRESLIIELPICEYLGEGNAGKASAESWNSAMASASVILHAAGVKTK